eukprot:5000831-Alexandrium_andersonii.AAC.1
MFSGWAKANSVQHSQQRFSGKLLSIDGKNAGSNPTPLFKGKAANTLAVLLWLESAMAGPEQATTHRSLRATVVRSLCRQWRMLHIRRVFFTHMQA